VASKYDRFWAEQSTPLIKLVADAARGRPAAVELPAKSSRLRWCNAPSSSLLLALAAQAALRAAASL
jgi:hypothetical protein